mmetsp:Transcript_25696/g.61281  ORF Transcript_25696/g.61281 Transcript_25696/m.61281 type:complete len:202 (+) Transcript_25696:2073-2678(+)
MLRLCCNSFSLASASFLAISSSRCLGASSSGSRAFSSVSSSCACCALRRHSSVSAWLRISSKRTLDKRSSSSILRPEISSSREVSCRALSMGMAAVFSSWSLAACAFSSAKLCCSWPSVSSCCWRSFSTCSSLSSSSRRASRRSCVAECSWRWRLPFSHWLSSSRYCSLPTVFDISSVACSIFTDSWRCRTSCCRRFSSCS